MADMRERLIELIIGADMCMWGTNKPFAEVYADYLIENGVIVPPCKVGNIVYYPSEVENKVLETTVEKIVIKNDNKWLGIGVFNYPFESIGRSIFLTKEEAEQALKEREQ